MASLMRSLVCSLGLLASADALNKNLRIGSGGRTLNDFRREAAAEANVVEQRDINPKDLYPQQKIQIPINHFPNDAKYAPNEPGMYNNRYWFDTSHYKPGGPVIILQSGEANAVQRLVYMQKGILAQLAEATNGIAVVFEHRYYGHSFPTATLSTENLRFLTTEQALADEAYFAQNIKFPGLEDKDLTSNTTAYISYGGSYSGAVSAFLRVKYPDIFWGSISSSGVTKAIYDYWEYYAPVAEYGPSFCMSTQKTFTDMVDNILIGQSNTTLITKLKNLFGMEGISHDSDFANQLAQGVGWWQELNWDPAVSYDDFYWFCDNLTSLNVLYPHTESKRSAAESIIQEGGYTANKTLVNQLLNYIGWIDLTAVSPCKEEGLTQNQCFSNLNKTFYEQDSHTTAEWRSWAYQYCTEWGFLQTGSGVPSNQKPLISRTINLEYLSTVCRDAFGIHKLPNLEEANQYGGYDIKHSRLAIINGQWDPWRPATPGAFKYGAPHRTSTTDEPFILIPKALHHYDENGLFPNETTPTLPPRAVASTQSEEQTFVKAWIKEYNQQSAAGRT